MTDKDAILVRLDALDQRQDERHQDITRRLAHLEAKVDTSEAWRNQQIGQGRTIGVAAAAFVSVAINAFWSVLTGRS